MTAYDLRTLLAYIPADFEVRIPSSPLAPSEPVISIQVNNAAKTVLLDWYPMEPIGTHR